MLHFLKSNTLRFARHSVLKPSLTVHCSLVSRYGSFLKILKQDSLNDLTLLMKHIKLFLSSQRVKATSDLSILFKNNQSTFQKGTILKDSLGLLYQSAAISDLSKLGVWVFKCVLWYV